jgi:hypothetical protein
MAKIKGEHLEHIRTEIAKHDTPELREWYKKNNMSDKRYRWDLTYRAGLTSWICSNLYSYANDDHIDTALRSIVSPL